MAGYLSESFLNAETSLHYNWNRYYDPATGRYISPDPIGLAGGLNTFGYVGQNPMGYADFDGLIKWKGSIRSAALDVMVIPVGINGYRIVLRSECINGETMYVDIWAGGISFGVGWPIAGNIAGVSFDDGRPPSQIDPYVFQGAWRMISGPTVSVPDKIPGEHQEFSNGNIVLNGIRSTKIRLNKNDDSGFQGSIGEIAAGYAKITDWAIFRDCTCKKGNSTTAGVDALLQ